MMKKMTNSSRIWTLLAVLVLSLALGAPPAIAVEIEEVQVVDVNGDPTSPFKFLLIYGKDFSDPPVIFLGTDTTPYSGTPFCGGGARTVRPAI